MAVGPYHCILSGLRLQSECGGRTDSTYDCLFLWAITKQILRYSKYGGEFDYSHSFQH